MPSGKKAMRFLADKWVICLVFGWFVGGLCVVCLVCGWFGWFVGSLDCLRVVWLVCGWFRVLQLTFRNQALINKIQEKQSYATHFDSMLKIRKKRLDGGVYICAIFMDLSKTFDTLNQNLLILKLGAYGFGTDALKYIKTCLRNRE